MQQTPLAAVWSQVTQLIEEGYSIMPVHEDGPDAKRPFGTWKPYQYKIISAAELWHQMSEQYHTNAIAVICGKVSGNLEIIDIDVKHEEGISAKYFKAIQDLFPELWERLRIHRSPSGGFHILYRTIDLQVPSNKKLAGRLKTEEEYQRDLAASKTGKTSKEQFFLETRGEGGYAVLPPSMGYSIFKHQPIPYLTEAERNDLISLAISYNRVIKIERPPAIKRKDDYYDENPFDHFNKSQEAQDLLLKYGWTYNKQNSEFIWFNRPGSKSRERHASFIRNKNLFYFWTTNEGFDNSRSYTPANILCQLEHNGDWKATHRALVGKGYGKIKPDKEARLIKGNQIPANISPEAKAIVKAKQELYPHGIFWRYESEMFSINREAIIRTAAGLGFLYHRQEVIQIQGAIIHRRNERYLFDSLKQYIREEDDDLLHAYEAFVQSAGSFIITRLPLLDLNLLLIDTPTEAYKFYNNTWLKITADGYEENHYDALPGYVWEERIQKRPFRYGNEGRYIDFLEKATEYSKLRKHIQGIIGYLSHEFKHPTLSYIIVITEQCADPRHGGGSGKNLFCNLFKNTTTVTTKAGNQIKYDEKFMQSWNGERIFALSDVPKNFDFLFLKELSSGEAIIKKLWKDEEVIPNSEMPKFIVHTNYSYEITDGGLKRRIIPLEFTDFFTKCGGVDVHYRTFFPEGWSDEDWAGYDGTLVDSLVYWFNSNLKLAPVDLTEGGWSKQFEQTYGIYTAEFIYEHWEGWLLAGFISNMDFKKQLHDYFEDKAIAKNWQPTSHRINKAIEDFFTHKDIKYKGDYLKSVNGLKTKGKNFEKGDDEEAPF